jgi:hypothetical protein
MRRFSDERGVAMVTALLVTLVVASLGLVVVQLSAHNATSSAFDRKRVQAVDAAEAGIELYFASLRQATGAALCSPASGTIPSSPGATYDVTVELYGAWPPSGAPLACPPPSGTTPAAVKVTSVGTAVSPGSTRAVARTMQTEARLVGLFPQHAFGIFSDTGLGLQNHLTVNGNAGNDANVYTNGNFTMANNTVISGSVFAQGAANITNGVVKADVWANGPVTLHSIAIFGNAISSTGDIALTNNTHVYRDAKAAGAITVDGSSQIDGLEIENATLGPPPTFGLPQVTYDPTAWQNAGYLAQTYPDCTQAKTAIMNGWAPGQNVVVRIPSTCTLSFSNNDTVTVRGNLAIITDGGFSTQNKVTFQGTAPYNLYVISVWRSGLSCSSGSYNLTFSNQSKINSLSLFAYSPCTLNYGNNNASGSAGQLIGSTVNITNQLIFNYRPVIVPSNVVGFAVEVSYLREVKTP